MIGDAYGDVNGRIILADTQPLITSAKYSLSFGATERTLWAFDAAPTTSMSHTPPLTARGNTLPYSSKDVAFLISLVACVLGYLTCMSSIMMSIKDCDSLGRTAMCWSTSSSYMLPLSCRHGNDSNFFCPSPHTWASSSLPIRNFTCSCISNSFLFFP